MSQVSRKCPEKECFANCPYIDAIVLEELTRRFPDLVEDEPDLNTIVGQISSQLMGTIMASEALIQKDLGIVGELTMLNDKIHINLNKAYENGVILINIAAGNLAMPNLNERKELFVAAWKHLDAEVKEARLHSKEAKLRKDVSTQN